MLEVQIARKPDGRGRPRLEFGDWESTTVEKIEDFVWVALHFQAQLANDIQAGSASRIAASQGDLVRPPSAQVRSKPRALLLLRAVSIFRERGGGW